MMIIAFNTIKGGLPWIEGLCAQILFFSSEIISGLRSHLLFFFLSKEEIC